MIDWLPISTAPVGPTVLLANDKAKEVTIGYGEWFSAPMPRWISVNPEGFGRWKATHWAPLPEPPKSEDD